MRKWLCFAFAFLVVAVSVIPVFADVTDAYTLDQYGTDLPEEFQPPYPYDPSVNSFVFQFHIPFYYEEDNTYFEVQFFTAQSSGIPLICEWVNGNLHLYYQNNPSDDVLISHDTPYICIPFAYVCFTDVDWNTSFPYCVSYFSNEFALKAISSYNSGISYSYQDGYEFGILQSSVEDYQTGFYDGETAGYTLGYNDGYASGFEDGGDATFGSAYDMGVAVGSVSALDNQSSWNNVFFGVLNAPLMVLERLMSFELFGISMWSIFISLMVFALIFAVVKMVK